MACIHYKFKGQKANMARVLAIRAGGQSVGECLAELRELYHFKRATDTLVMYRYDASGSDALPLADNDLVTSGMSVEICVRPVTSRPPTIHVLCSDDIRRQLKAQGCDVHALYDGHTARPLRAGEWMSFVDSVARTDTGPYYMTNNERHPIAFYPNPNK